MIKKIHDIGVFGFLLCIIGAFQLTYNINCDAYSTNIRLWHPISWIIVLFLTIIFICFNFSINDVIGLLKNESVDQFKKVSIWKNN